MVKHYYFVFFLAAVFMTAMLTRWENPLGEGINRSPAAQTVSTHEFPHAWTPHGKFAD